MIKKLLGLLSLIVCIFTLFAGEDIWIEGESADSSTMEPHNWYSGSIKKEELSGEDFLSHFASGASPEATFRFDAAESGSYNFWVRMNPVASPQALYNLNGESWQAKEELVKLADVMIKSDNEYSAITVVSMDGAPISSSKKILVQIGTYNRPYEFEEEEVNITQKGKGTLKGFKIVSTGQSIWNVEKAKGMVSISNPFVSKAYALDANGMPIKELELRKSGERVILTLPEDALYVVLK